MASTCKKVRPHVARVGLLALCALPCACGFPELSYATEPIGDGASSLDARGTIADAGDDLDSEAFTDGRPVGDSSAADEPPSRDAAMDTGIDAPLECDQDGDGFLAKNAACKGTDCCDTDFSANPGQKQFFDVADRCGSFDYDCDGAIEAEYLINVKCSGLATGCQGGPGFTSDPACGTLAPYSTCQPSGLGCAASSMMMTAQGCH